MVGIRLIFSPLVPALAGPCTKVYKYNAHQFLPNSTYSHLTSLKMAKDDYLTSTPGGSLRLKGAKDAGVTKKKKKKKSKPPSSPNSGADQKPNKESEDPGKADRELSEDSRIEEGTAAKERAANPAQEVDVEEEEVGGPHVYKTEAERRHEDMRRKRVCS